jgi:hypothetical protein
MTDPVCGSETVLNGGGFALAYNSRSAMDTRRELSTRFDRLLLRNPAPHSPCAPTWPGRTTG